MLTEPQLLRPFLEKNNSRAIMDRYALVTTEWRHSSGVPVISPLTSI
jgi:hypothetical protein